MQTCKTPPRTARTKRLCFVSTLLILCLLLCGTAALATEIVVEHDSTVEGLYRMGIYRRTTMRTPEGFAPPIVAHEDRPEPVSYDSFAEVQDKLHINIKTPQTLPPGYSPDRCEYTMHMYNERADHLRLHYPAEAPADSGLYIMVEFVGSQAIIKLEVSQEPSKVTLNETDLYIFESTSEDSLYLLWTHDRCLYRMTCPSMTQDAAIQIATAML